MTQSEQLFEPPSGRDQQWRLDSLLLCNWGGFDGIHEIPIDGMTTLLSGVSGAGKSTVLDAWTTLLTPNVALNAASNEVGARTRGDGTRTTLTYVRGQYGIIDRADRSIPLVLRGAKNPGALDLDPQDTWSAIAAVFVSSGGIHTSFLRTFFCPREAVNPGDMKTQYAVFLGKLHAHHVTGYLEPAATTSEFGKTALERLPGLTVHQPTGYHEELQRKLGIGAHGAGDKALKLLADIQRGKPVSRVSRLFQDFALEQPVTFEKAQKVVDSFDDLDKMHTQMRDAEQQLAVLDGIDTAYDEMAAAIEEAREIDTLGLSAPGRSKFSYWANQYKSRLYEDEAALAAEEHAAALVTLQARQKTTKRLDGALDAARTEYLNAGGGDADTVSAKLTGLKDDRDRVEDNRHRFAAATAALELPVPDSVEAFTRSHTDSRRFLTGFDESLTDLRGRSHALLEAKWTLDRQIQAHEKEIQRLAAARGSNINGYLVDVRDQFARAAGMAPTDLPFVGELLDMHTDWEHWRHAADAELGGFANTVLLDERIEARFRRAINDLPDLRRRLTFRAVPVNLPVLDAAETRYLSGRLVVKDGPFAGWLRKQVNTSYDLLCVETDREFTKDAAPQIARSGQTKREKRGAHGSSGRVIGFSNVARRAELQEEITQWQEAKEPIEKELGEFDKAEKELVARRSAHEHVVGARWADLDIGDVEAAIARAEAELQRLMQDANLDLLKHALEVAKSEHGEAVREEVLQEKAVETAEQRKAQVEAESRRLIVLLNEWASAPDAIPSPEQVEDLDTRLGLLDDLRWEGGPDGFDEAIRTLRHALERDMSAATNRRDVAIGVITGKFREYQAHPDWHSDSRGATLSDYPDYLAILTELRDRGLHALRRDWARQVIEWSGEDLSELIQSYRRAEDDIDERLRPIRAILAAVPFGRDGHTLDIEAVHRRPAPVVAYLHELRTLASGTMNPNATDDQVLEKFAAIREAVARIRTGKDERNSLLDIRRHLAVKAHAGGMVYDHLGELSGGEGQMITAFIVGAALRYHLGDEKRNRPRFAPVVLDEAFIKADGEYTGAAVDAWNQLGFQLIVGAPEEKVNSLEAALDQSIVVTKNPEHYSYASRLPRKATT
ncbi:ATP-binding protein [Jatrophihabitans fulvus]